MRDYLYRIIPHFFCKLDPWILLPRQAARPPRPYPEQPLCLQAVVWPGVADCRLGNTTTPERIRVRHFVDSFVKYGSRGI